MKLSSRFLPFLLCLAWLPGLALSVFAARSGNLDTTLNPMGAGSEPGSALMTLPDRTVVTIVSLAELPDGKCIALAYDEFGPVLIQYLPDGTADTSFGGNGVVVLPPGLSPAALVVQSDARILATASNGNVRLFRYLPGGAPDLSFGTDGAVTLDGPSAPSYAIGLALLDDGKILLAGAAPDKGTGFPHKPRLWRLQPDGTPDLTFGTAGMATIPLTGGSVTKMALQPDGKVVLAGIWDTMALLPFLVRCDASGQYDPLFGDGGLVTLPPPEVNSVPTGVVVQPDGAIVMASTNSTRVPADFFMSLHRFLPDGRLDPAFNSGGVVVTNPTPGEDFPTALALQPDGKLVTAGVMNDQLAILRYHPHGALDEGFGEGGIVTVQTPGLDCIAHAMTLLADGRILTGGSSGLEPFERKFMLVRALGSDVPETLAAALPAGAPLKNGGTLRMVYVRGDSGNPETTITLRNITDQPLTNITAVLRGPDTARFELLSALPSVLPAGGTAGLTLRFFPSLQTSTFAATLVIESTDPAAPHFVIRLRGVFELPAATMALTQNGSALPHDSTLSFGATLPSAPVTRTLTIQNTGNIPLHVLGISLAATGHPEDFIPGIPDMAPLAPGASTDFPVTFTPSGPGMRTARLRIVSNDTLNPPHEITLSGRFATGMDAWRVTHFGSSENAGSAADLSDPDHDGIPNLLEYATLSHPLASSPPPGALALTNDTLEYTFTRPATARDRLLYRLHHAETLPGPWSPIPWNETILTDDGATQKVLITAPKSPDGRAFVRLSVTKQ